MASNIEVSIVANVADFQEKLRAVQQDLKESVADLNKWTQEVQASGGANAYAVGRQKEAALAVAEHTVAQKELTAGLAATLGPMSQFSGSTAIATRELLVLGREAARGNWSRMAGSLTILATQGFGVQTSMLAAAAGVAALVGGLLFLITRADQAAVALAHIQLGASFEGGLSLSTQQIQGLITQLDRIPGVSEADAQKVVAAFSSMRTTSVPEIQALGASVKDYADLTQQSVDKAAEALKKSFDDPLKNVVAFVTGFRNATEAQKEQAEAAERSGNANAAAAVMVDALRAAMANRGKILDELAVKQSFSLLHLNDEAEATLRVNAQRRAATEHISEEAAALEILTEARQKANAAALQQTGAVAGLGTDPNAAMMAAIADAAKLDPTISKTQQLQAEIRNFTALLPEATEQAKRLGSSMPLDQLTAGLKKAQTELASLQLGPIIDNAHLAIAKLESTWSGSAAGMVAAERNIWAGVAQATSVGTDQHRQAVEEMGRLDVQLRQKNVAEVGKVGREAIAQAREDISEIEANDSLGRQQQLAGARAVWKQLLDGDKLTKDQRVEVTREFNTSVAALNRQAAADTKAISLDQLKTDIEIRKLQLDAQKSGLDAQVAAHQITAAQKYAIERTLVSELAGLDVEELQNEQAGLDQQSVEYQVLADKIRVIRAKLNVDLAGLNKHDLDTEAADWQSFSGTVNGAFDAMVSGVLQGTQTIWQAFGRMTGNMILVFVEAVAKMMFQWLAFEVATMSGWTKLAGAIGSPFSGGGLGGLIGGAFGVGGGAASAASTAAIPAETTLAAAQTAATPAMAALGIAQTAAAPAATALAAAEIPATAAQTSLAAALISSIPAMTALAASMAASAGTSGAGGVASVLGGMGRFLGVFQEGTPEVAASGFGFLHKGEMIIPQPFAGILRSGPANAGSAPDAAGGGMIFNYSPQVSAVDTSGIQRMLDVHGRLFARTVANLFRANTDLRPNY